MNVNAHLLEWDSRFFGIKVARVVDPHPTTAQLAATLRELKVGGVKLVYWFSATPYPADEAERLGGRLVDAKTTFVMDLDTLDSAESPLVQCVEAYTPSMPVSDIESLAIQSGEHSRFAVDERIPRDRFEALYKTWIHRSLAKEIASEVLVIRESSRLVGFVTVGEKEKRGDIGLVAVDKGSRGRRYGEGLVRAAQNWFVGRKYHLAQVVTQGRNIAACRLYEKCGYSVEKVEYIYHFWL